MNNTDKPTLGQSSATSYNQSYCSSTSSDLSIGELLSDINPVCVDAVLQVLDIGDKRRRVDCNTFQTLPQKNMEDGWKMKVIHMIPDIVMSLEGLIGIEAYSFYKPIS